MIEDSINSNIPVVNKNKKIKFIFISISIIILILIAAYPLIPVNKKSTQTTSKSVEIKQKLSPKELYLTMKTKFEKITNFSEYEALFKEYGSQNKIVEIEKQRQNIDVNSPLLLDFVNISKEESPLVKDMTDIKETISKNSAILEIKTVKPNLTGQVSFVLENNQWKLDKEEWFEFFTATETATPQ